MVGGVTAGQHGSTKQQHPAGPARPGSKGGPGDSGGEHAGESAGSGGEGGDGTDKGKYLCKNKKQRKPSEIMPTLLLGRSKLMWRQQQFFQTKFHCKF